MENAKWGANNTSTLVVRECYDTIITTIRDKEYANVLLKGTPGIGKTFFMYYFIFSLVKNNSHKIVIAVAYLVRETQKTIYISVDGQDVTVSNSYAPVPDYYFSDSVDIEKNNASKCLTALFASMDEKHFRTFQKILQQPTSKSADMYVPLVPMSELGKMVVNERILQSTVQFRRDIYGGSARNCLDDCDHRVDDSIKTKLREYLNMFFADSTEIVVEEDMDWAATTLTFHLAKLFAERADLALLERSVVMHQFVHPTELKPLEKTFCSSVMKYVCGRLVQNYQVALENRIRDLFGGSGTGILFESMAFDTMYQNLKDGHSYHLQPVKRNITGEVSTLHCDVKRKVLIRTISDIQNLNSGDVGVPVVGNFPVADFVVGTNLLQMTVAASHPVKKERLEEFCAALGTNSPRLIFVTEAKSVNSFMGCPSLTSGIQQYVTTPDITASVSVLGKVKETRSKSSSGSRIKKAK